MRQNTTIKSRVGWASLACGVTVVATSLACSNPLAGPTSENYKACQAYVQHINELACLHLTYDVQETCATADDMSVPMAAYFDCLVDNIECTGSTTSMAVAQCDLPTI